LGNSQEHAYLSVPKPHSATAAALDCAGSELDCDSAPPRWCSVEIHQFVSMPRRLRLRV